jgi:predicted nucleic acid-binding protein
MITAVDTNVLVALWDRDDALNSTAQAALDAAFARGKLVISGPVFAELLALPRERKRLLKNF